MPFLPLVGFQFDVDAMNEEQQPGTRHENKAGYDRGRHDRLSMRGEMCFQRSRQQPHLGQLVGSPSVRLPQRAEREVPSHVSISIGRSAHSCVASSTNFAKDCIPFVRG